MSKSRSPKSTESDSLVERKRDSSGAKIHGTTASIVSAFLTKAPKLNRPVMTADLPVAVNPHKMQEDLAGQLSEHVITELKRTPYPTRIAKSKSAVAETPDGKSGSEMYLDRLVGPEGTTAEKLHRFVLERGYDEHFEQAMLTALTEERAFHERQFSTFYHGASYISGMMSDVFSEIQRAINIQNDSDLRHFRLVETSFKTLPTIEEFIRHFQHSVDHDAQYKEMALCVNPFLFGNHNNPGECSYHFFAANASISHDMLDPFNASGLFSEFLRDVGVGEEQLKKLLTELNLLANKMIMHGGRLFQIHVDNDTVNSAFFPAKAMGRRYEREGKEGAESISMKDVLSSAMSGELSQQEIFDLQARFYMHPDVMNDPDKIRIKSSFHHPLSDEETLHYNNAIKKIAAEVSAAILYQHRSEQIFLSPKPLAEAFRNLKAELLQDEQEFKPNLHFQYLLQAKAFNQVPHFLKNWPELANLELFKTYLFNRESPISHADLSKLTKILLETQDDKFMKGFIDLLHDQQRLAMTLTQPKHLVQCLEIAKAKNYDLFSLLKENINLLSRDPRAFQDVMQILESKESVWRFVSLCKENMAKVTGISLNPTHNQLLTEILNRIPVSNQSQLLEYLGDLKKIVNIHHPNFIACFTALSPDLRLRMLQGLGEETNQMLENNLNSVFMLIPDADKSQFMKTFFPTVSDFNFCIRRALSKRDSDPASLIKFLGDEKADLAFRVDNLSGLVSVFKPFTGSVSESKEQNEFDALLKFIDTYVTSKNKRDIPPDTMFNIFLNLVDKKYLNKMLDGAEKEKAFMEKVPQPCVSRMTDLLLSGKASLEAESDQAQSHRLRG